MNFVEKYKESLIKCGVYVDVCKPTSIYWFSGHYNYSTDFLYDDYNGILIDDDGFVLIFPNNTSEYVSIKINCDYDKRVEIKIIYEYYSWKL